MSNIWVFDCEGDGLDPTKFHCLAACDPQSTRVHVTADYEQMKKILRNADVLIGHNIIRWDIPHLERILGIKIRARLVDTLALSWYLYPDRNRHGLEWWGNDYGIKKPFILDWENQTQEEYEHRCKEDVKINTRLWKDMYKYLFDIYGSDNELWKLLDYLSLKIHCARLQEESKWKLDIGNIVDNLSQLTAIQSEKKDNLVDVMPRVPTTTTKSRPKVFVKKNGDFSVHGMEWVKLCADHGFPPSHTDDIEIVTGSEQGNPSSPSQMKDWLFSLGWKPRAFKYKKNEDGTERAIPQINLEQGKGICDSIKAMYKDYPYLELIEGLSVLQHRIGILNGFLRDQEDGWIKAQVSGLTNTLRFQHTTVVNLPKVDKLYASSVRASLTAPSGMELCGSDMASLEDRIKQHYIFPLDPDYVKEMITDDYDPHLSLALSAGSITQKQKDDYMAGTDKSIKPLRDIFKNGNYACQYGTGVAKLALTAGIDKETAAHVHKSYWKKNWAIKEVAKQQTWKIVNDQMWLFNPVSHLWYSLRFEKDIFSTLVQGTASFVFDLWVKQILEEREQLTAQFHDEVVLCVRQGHSHYNEETKKWEGPIVDFLRRMIKKTNDILKLNRDLDIDVQFGSRYSEIH